MDEQPRRTRKPTSSLEGVEVPEAFKSAPASGAEVSGHMSPGAYYICWNCGAVYYVTYGWTQFRCPNCGSHSQPWDHPGI